MTIVEHFVRKTEVWSFSKALGLQLYREVSLKPRNELIGNFVLFVSYPRSSVTFQEKIESSTDVLKSILKPIIQQDEEIVWPPRDLNLISDMKKVNAYYYI